jgi:UDP-3-O-[3-hydroxymyristoyl] glucosamine N-acyltransferase
VSDANDLFALIRSLWTIAADRPIAAILPRDPETLRTFYPRLRDFVSSAPRGMAGTIDPAAIVQGEIIAMGEGSHIEAGAIIHPSCRLILGARSLVRAGAVLRDEVVVGDDSLIGVHCEVVRSVLLGPQTLLGHFIYLADSVIGREVNVAGNVWVANTTVSGGATIPLVYKGTKIDSGRSHLGMLAGDGVRFGASTTVCPGCIVLPNLVLPPSITLYGTIDGAKRRALMKHFVRTWVE